jgi:RNA polymerase primary sigma factor
MVGLELEINEDGDTLLDVIKNENALDPDHTFKTKDLLKEALMKILSKFDNREKIIIEDYFGLYGQPKTLEEIGNELNLTKERVRQIKQKVLKKLRNESMVLFNHL